jgi:hypothetical protein
VRLETVDLDGKPDVITLKVDLEYWPTYELRREGGVWERAGLREETPSARLVWAKKETQQALPGTSTSSGSD